MATPSTALATASSASGFGAARAAAVVVAAALVAAATLAAFWPVTQASFVSWRDRENIVESALVQARAFDRIWSEPIQNRYLPVATSWWALLTPAKQPVAETTGTALSAPTGSLSATHFHQAQLALAVGIALLTFWVLYRITAHVAASAAGALLFAVHPWQTETVGWLSQAPQLLGLVLGLAALAIYFTLATIVPKTHLAAPPNSSLLPLGYLAATVFYALALLADPLALFAPVLGLALDVAWLRPRQPKRELPMRWALLLLWLFLGTVAVVQVRFSLPRANFGEQTAGLFDQMPWLSVATLGLAVMLLLSFWLGSWGRTLLAVGLFLLALLPAAGYFPGMVERPLTTPVTAWALLGPAAALTAGLSRRDDRLAFGLVAALVAIFLTVSHVEARSWHSDRALAARLRTAPGQGALAAVIEARDALARSDHAGAEASLAIALQANPKFVPALVERGLLSLASGEKTAASEQFQAALKLAPDDTAALDGWGQTLGTSLARSNEAIAAFRSALKFDPHRPETYVHLGFVELHNGDTQGAMASFETALKLRPEMSAAFLGLAVANARFPEQDRDAIYRSIDNANRALKLDPALDEARELLVAGHRRLSTLLAAEGQTAAAEEELKAILQVTPNSYQTLSELGNLLLPQQRFDEAEARFQEALTIEPTYLEARFGLGVAAWAKNNVADAEASFRAVLSDQPNHPGSQFQLALICEQQGRIAEALAGYRAALVEKARFVRWTSAANNLAWILATCEDAQYRNGAEAVTWAEEVFQFCLPQQPPEFLEYVDTLAAAYAEVGKFDEAIKLCRRAVEMCETYGNPEGKTRFQRRLELFITNRPVREPIIQATSTETPAAPEPEIDPNLPPPDLDTPPAELPEAPAEMPEPPSASPPTSAGQPSPAPAGLPATEPAGLPATAP